MSTQQLKDVATAQNNAVINQPNSSPIAAGFFDLQGFELLQRVAKAFASSELVPKTYQGNLANCMIAMDMANRIGANPLMAMQNLYVVHGTPSWSSKFLIATINACGRFSSLRYEWTGQPGTDDYGCRAWAIERETGERLDGILVNWKMVNAEGWATKNGSKWKTMPDQMFVYRAAAFWQRAYAPELGMGLQTTEEIHDIIDMNPDGSVASVTTEKQRPAQRKTLRDQVLNNSQETTIEEPEQAPIAEQFEDGSAVTEDGEYIEASVSEEEPEPRQAEEKPAQQTRRPRGNMGGIE